MTHPSKEDLISLVYGEIAGEERALIEAHLDACVQCRQHIEQWRGAMGQLDTWQLPEKPGVFRVRPASLRWAAAAMVLIAIGFGIGFLARSPSTDIEALYEALRPRIEASLEPAVRRTAAAEAQLAVDASAEALGDRVARGLRGAFAEDIGTLAIEGAATRAAVLNLAEAVDRARAEDRLLTAAVVERLETARVRDYSQLSTGMYALASATAEEILLNRDNLERLRAGLVGAAAEEAAQGEGVETEGSVK
ncbi:MAG: anti-sigma factor family protein [Planctomycetota bacterium]|jgi:hypothetical protein